MSIVNVNKISPVGSGSTVTIAGIASVTNNISVGNSGGDPNPNPVSGGAAILWWFCCFLVGYAQWGQTGKGFVWLVIVMLTGFGGFVALVDYIMCYQAQKKRKLSEWEFFPTA